MTVARMHLTTIRIWPSQLQLADEIARLPTRLAETALFPNLAQPSTRSEVLRRAIKLGLAAIVKETVNECERTNTCPTLITPLLLASDVRDSGSYAPRPAKR